MVQVLSNPKNRNPWDDIGSLIGQGFNKGVGSGIEQFHEMQENAKKTKSQKELAQQLVMDKYNQSQVDFENQKQFEEFKQDLIQKNNKNLIDQYKDLTSGGSQNNSTNENSQEVNEDQPFSSTGKKIPMSQIAALSITNPALGQRAQSYNDSIDKENKFTQTESNKDRRLKAQQDLQQQQFGHKETTKYAESVTDKAENAKDAVRAIQSARKAIKSGQTGVNAKNILFKYLGSKKSPFASMFLSPENQTMITAAKTLAGGGVKEIFTKPTEREFFWFENILPDIFKSNETNEQSLKYFEDIANYNLKKQEIYEQIVKDNKGYRPIDTELKVNEKMKPYTDNLVKEGYKAAGKTLMRNPKGKLFAIPNDKVKQFLSEGGEIEE